MRLLPWVIATCGIVITFPALTASAARSWTDLFESACRRTGLSLQAAALCMGIDQGQLRRQLDMGTFSAARLLALPSDTLEELLSLIAESKQIPIVTRGELEKYLRLRDVITQPVAMRPRAKAEKVSA